MKKFLLIAVAALLSLAGCSIGKVDTDKLQNAFKGPSMSDDTRAELARGVTALNSTNYQAALTSFNKVAYGAKMTKDQKEVIEDAIEKVKEHIKKGK